MADLDLRLDRRDVFVERLSVALVASVLGSVVRPRGSLAAGVADEFSDIDLEWSVEAESFATAVASVTDALAVVAPLASVRWDPDHLDTPGRCLAFARFEGMPLFWRLDLEITAANATSETLTDSISVPAWSLPASAMANAVAAIKALCRHQPETAAGLLERGFDRVDERWAPEEGRLVEIRRLASEAANRDPQLRATAQEVAEVAGVLVR